jgi:hypothetical protein
VTDLFFGGGGGGGWGGDNHCVEGVSWYNIILDYAMPRINTNHGVFVLVSSLAHCIMRENNGHYWKNVKVWNKLMSKLVLLISKISPSVLVLCLNNLYIVTVIIIWLFILLMEVSCIEKCLHNYKRKSASSVEVKNEWNYTFTPLYASWSAQKLMQYKCLGFTLGQYASHWR